MSISPATHLLVSACSLLHTSPPCFASIVCFLFSDWFKAGKGPDPKVASLDRGLDSYWSKAAEKTNGDAAAGDKMEDTDAPAPVVVAPVAGVDPDL